MQARQFVIAAALLALAGGAMAQSNLPPGGGTANGATSPDPFVQKRQADSESRAQYRERKKAANQKSRAERSAAKKEFRQQRGASTATRNADLARPQTDRAP